MAKVRDRGSRAQFLPSLVMALRTRTAISYFASGWADCSIPTTRRLDEFSDPVESKNTVDLVRGLWPRRLQPTAEHVVSEKWADVILRSFDLYM